ncbi:nitrous oxide reductase family maturation protein NosD [Maritalea porphyrae]|uniref:nitrous oxide reductase family maturation protein NosD n=1 Tax=Maritalea porphyrae TaxID=880732 RepID=UPI0022B02679|nr:nitrous oxide reductase family maturation protein NosD [Maritalea porphyrae]MCZ4271938.1 nitrous oxide reductase family maturation protein NosD [Maritalea porphyrae]
MLRLLAFLLVISSAATAVARDWQVVPEGDALAITLEQAEAGDIIRLAPGTYQGPIEINVSLVLDGLGHAHIKGNENGSVIVVNAKDVTVRGVTVTGSGSDRENRDAGIITGKGADRALIENNILLGNLVGVDIHGTKNALVQHNKIEGRLDHRMNDRGNGIYVWNATGSKVIGNDIRYGRDGIFVNTSKKNEFTGNRMRDLRFAIHYMHANNSIVRNNVSLGNHLGYAIMYSDNVVIEGNLSRGDRDHGIMLNYTNKSTVLGNRIEEGGEKCVFIYNAHKNDFSRNLFSQCQIGIHFTAGSERNSFVSNAFVSNRTQVKYVGSKWVDWSVDGKGNYWSDHAAFDLDGNGIADAAYRPNDIMDHVLWTQPAAKSLLGSPAVQLIRWSQSAFPALLPGGVVDRAPLMQPDLPTLTQWEEN